MRTSYRTAGRLYLVLLSFCWLVSAGAALRAGVCKSGGCSVNCVLAASFSAGADGDQCIQWADTVCSSIACSTEDSEGHCTLANITDYVVYDDYSGCQCESDATSVCSCDGETVEESSASTYTGCGGTASGESSGESPRKARAQAHVTCGTRSGRAGRRELGKSRAVDSWIGQGSEYTRMSALV